MLLKIFLAQINIVSDLQYKTPNLATVIWTEESGVQPPLDSCHHWSGGLSGGQYPPCHLPQV